MELMNKKDVAATLGICERTLEKLVEHRRFPPPLRLGKSARWAKPAVERWLAMKLQPQMEWTRPGPKPRKTVEASKAPSQT